ncbi:unnamed protein product [Thlaspi arvense]|uniref:DUF7900 domain-containing protein n=1 Tax=Thlaspi arvense TaxID=13288 RepID=A0AAU9SU04_THLAR|nr:unnamed protein product [Thlaspi arvense]
MQMSHSASSSTIEYKNEKGVLCICKGLAKHFQAWTYENPGRRLYACKGRRAGHGYEQCNLFGWYDVEKPHGWQYLALLEVRDTMRVQKKEIRNLREAVRALTHEAEMKMEDPISLVDELKDKLKQTRKECEAQEREVLILNKRSRVFRNVLISSSVGFTLVVGVMMVMWK